MVYKKGIAASSICLGNYFIRKESEKWTSSFPVWRNLIKLHSDKHIFPI